MKININYSKKNLAERILFLFLKEKKLLDFGIMDSKSLTDYFLNVDELNTFINLTEKINIDNDKLKKLTFPIQDKTQEMEDIILFIESKVDNEKFKKFENIFQYTKKLVKAFNFNDLINKLEVFYDYKINELNIDLLPYTKSTNGISGLGNSFTKNITLFIGENITEFTDKSVIRYVCHEIAHLYETETVIKLMKNILAKEEKSFIQSWHIARKKFKPTYIVREILANLFSGWEWSLSNHLYGTFGSPKLALENIENKKDFLNGNFDLEHNPNYHKVYYLYAYLMKDVFWDYINNNKKIDENFFIELKKNFIK